MYYRRAKRKGGMYFLTVNIAERQLKLLTENIEQLKASIQFTKRALPFEINAIVILPDHYHLIMTLPANDENYSKRIGCIKSHFSRQLPKTERINKSRLAKRERGVWQRRFWEHEIRNEQDYARHVNYIHYNPVKHGYVEKPIDWPYSSIHRYVAQGILHRDWAGKIKDADNVICGYDI